MAARMVMMSLTSPVRGMALRRRFDRVHSRSAAGMDRGHSRIPLSDGPKSFLSNVLDLAKDRHRMPWQLDKRCDRAICLPG